MAREKITEKLQAEFDKPHFQIGAAVFFSWLGAKKYGHVTTFKKTNWGIQYTVRSFKGTSYPCGISIDGSTTSYKVGIIYSESSVMLKLLAELEQKSKITEFLQTPEGQRYRAQHIIQEADQLLISITYQLQTLPNLSEGQCLAMNLAIHELVIEIQKQENLLNQL